MWRKVSNITFHNKWNINQDFKPYEKNHVNLWLNNKESIIDSFQQWRLIPKLAATYVLAYFARTFFMNFVELQVGMMMGATGEEQVSLMT